MRATGFTEELLPEANTVSRQPLPASHLILALQCGGSDGYSGISANPALGAVVDLLVRHGGAAVLSETPEIYGADHLLTRRAVSREVGEKIVERIRWWEDHCAKSRGRSARRCNGCDHKLFAVGPSGDFRRRGPSEQPRIVTDFKRRRRQG